MRKKSTPKVVIQSKATLSHISFTPESSPSPISKPSKSLSQIPSYIPLPEKSTQSSPSKKETDAKRKRKGRESKDGFDTTKIVVKCRKIGTKAEKAKSIGIKQEEEEKQQQSPTEYLQRPTPEECHAAVIGLSALHPHVVETNEERKRTLLESCGMRKSVTDAVISTMLSQNTTDANSKAAWTRLKRSFPTWESVVECENLEEIEDVIRVAGLARTRAERIQALLRTIRKERGSTCLEYLRKLSDKEVKAELSRFKGIGPKTISCVLLFALGRSEFPVDTHVHRISKKLKWVSETSSRESAYEHLNARVPNEHKMDLHCLLVAHGKHCHRCAANGKPQFPPKDGSKLKCPLIELPAVKSEDEPSPPSAEEVMSIKKEEEEELIQHLNDSIKQNYGNNMHETVFKKEE